jgi:hypothetical protein
MFSKNIAPLVQMAQAMINIPEKAFLGRFMDIVPQKLSCYQRNNTTMNKKMLEVFQFSIEKDDIFQFKKMMDVFAKQDTLRRKELINCIFFNVKKCIIGYIQQITLFADSKWAVICFSEAQLLFFLADLEMDQAMIWNGTNPSTLCKDKYLIFPILIRAAYGSTLKRNGNIKSPPGKVVVR